MPNHITLNTFLVKHELQAWKGNVCRDFNIDCDIITFTNQELKQKVIYYCQDLSKTPELDAIKYLLAHIERQKNITQHNI